MDLERCARESGRAETCVVGRSRPHSAHPYTHTLVRNGRVTRINICSGGNTEFEIGRARLDEAGREEEEDRVGQLGGQVNGVGRGGPMQVPQEA